ncbi:TPA: hypothetical protein DCZ39_02160 [Patescibacteria group bacterium]|nr:hypothetical protein [Candidatus Gracilibacteria bacterium]
MGIPHVGKKMAQDIAEQLTDEDIVTQLTNEEFLSSIYGIGEKTVKSMTKFFHAKHNLKLLEQLKEY